MNIKEGQWMLREGELLLQMQVPVNKDGQPELWTEKDWRMFFREKPAHLDLEVDVWKRQGKEAEEGKKSDESEGLEYTLII